MLQDILQILGVSRLESIDGVVTTCDDTGVAARLDLIQCDVDKIIDLNISELGYLTETQKTALVAWQTEQIKLLRSARYKELGLDLVLFEAMRTNGDLTEWKDAMNEVDAEYPLPSD